MDNRKISVATANIRISNLYYFDHHCYYAFDIMFDNASTFSLYNIIAIAAGYDEEKSEEFLKSVKKYFANAGICNGDLVSVLYSGGFQTLAIGAYGKDLWIDVSEGIFPHIPFKTSSELGFNIPSLEVI